MTAGRFVKKPVPIECRQWDGSLPGATAIIDWILANGGTARFVAATDPHPLRCTKTDNAPFIVIDTLEGPTRLRPFAWAARGVRGEFYPIAEDIFDESYTEWIDPGYTVELGGETFTKAQWENVIEPMRNRLAALDGLVATAAALHSPPKGAAIDTPYYATKAEPDSPPVYIGDAGSGAPLIDYRCPGCGMRRIHAASAWAWYEAPAPTDKDPLTSIAATMACPNPVCGKVADLTIPMRDREPRVPAIAPPAAVAELRRMGAPTSADPAGR